MKIGSGTVVEIPNRRYLYQGDSGNLKLTEIGGRREIKKSYEPDLGRIKKIINDGSYREGVYLTPKERRVFVSVLPRQGEYFDVAASYKPDGSLKEISSSQGNPSEIYGSIKRTLKESGDDLSVRAKKELNKMLKAIIEKTKNMV